MHNSKALRVQIARYGLGLVLTAALGFHVGVLLGFVPDAIVWGGRIADPQQRIHLETLSLSLNLIFWIVVVGEKNLLSRGLPARIIRIVYWSMAAVFFLNTLGNLAAISIWEKVIFTPITILLCYFAYG